MEKKIITRVKKNFHEYKIIERFIAGIVLTGNEIKSIRDHQVSINNAYILPQNKELYIINMSITNYKYSHIRNLTNSYDTKKKRKILLKRKEVNKVVGAIKAKNYAFVPLYLFINNKGWAKLEIALAQRLRKYQIKAKNKEREIERKIKQGDFY